MKAGRGARGQLGRERRGRPLYQPPAESAVGDSTVACTEAVGEARAGTAAVELARPPRSASRPSPGRPFPPLDDKKRRAIEWSHVPLSHPSQHQSASFPPRQTDLAPDRPATPAHARRRWRPAPSPPPPPPRPRQRPEVALERPRTARCARAGRPTDVRRRPYGLRRPCAPLCTSSTTAPATSAPSATPSLASVSRSRTSRRPATSPRPTGCSSPGWGRWEAAWMSCGRAERASIHVSLSLSLSRYLSRSFSLSLSFALSLSLSRSLALSLAHPIRALPRTSAPRTRPHFTECPIGTASNATGAVSEDTCEACGSGSYAPEPGSTLCDNCPVGHFCDPPVLRSVAQP